MYKDKEKAKQAARERKRKQRMSRLVTPFEDVTPFDVTPSIVPLSDEEVKELCRQHLEPHTFREIENVIATNERLGIPEKDIGRWQRAYRYHQWSRFR